eukprot:scaffold79448_cov45-Attheya_sp.AAC.1
MSFMSGMPVDPEDREAYNVRRAMAVHHRRVIHGSKCRDCWFEPRNCMCALAKEWLQVPTGIVHQAAQQQRQQQQRRPIQFLMLFHSREVGNLSSTGKLVIAGGLGTGFVNGWVEQPKLEPIKPSAADDTSTDTPIHVDPDQSAMHMHNTQNTIGLRGDVGFAAALDDAARLGPVAVLYPEDDAVEVTHFHNLCQHPNIDKRAIEAPLDVDAQSSCHDNDTM